MNIKVYGILVFVASVFVHSTFGYAMGVRKVVSKNGIIAWLVIDKSQPLISLSFAFRGTGFVTDPPGKDGVAKVVSRLLLEGAGDLRSLDYQRALEESTAEISFSAARDHFMGRVRTIKAEQEKAFKLLRMALLNPRFDLESLRRARSQILAAIRKNSENPNYRSSLAWVEGAFFGHPYAKLGMGTVETINGIKRVDLTSFVENRFSRDRLVIGVAGDISEATLKEILDDVFGKLPINGKRFDISETHPFTTQKLIIIQKPIPQSIIVLGHKGLKRNDPDWYAALLVTEVLGGSGFSSRLYREIREKRGLAYSVYSYLKPMQYSTLLMGRVATTNEKAKRTLDLVKGQWQEMGKRGLTEAELKDAKKFMNGSFPLRLRSTRAIANILLGIQLANLGEAYLNRRRSLINSVSLSQANRVASELFKVNELLTVVVGNPNIKVKHK